MKWIVISGLLLFMVASLAWGGASGLPKGYEQWQKSERKIVTDKNSLFYGSHYIYADRKAVAGYRNDNRFAEGSRIVVEFFNLGNNPAVDGTKNMIVLMKRDKTQQQTGGWLFAGFGADGKPSGLDPVTTCFGCHQRDAAQRQFVISTKKDFKAL